MYSTFYIINICLILRCVQRATAATTTCTSYLQNGQFSKNCSFNLNALCPLTCNAGYEPLYSLEALRCLSTGKWTYNGFAVCQRACPAPVIPYGNPVATMCSRLSGQKCAYTCNPGYERDKTTPILLCSDGQWDVARMDGLCRKNPAGIEDDKIGIGLGIGGFLLLVCALAAIFIVLRRRGYLRWPSSQTGNSDSRMTHANTSSQPQGPFFVSQFPMPPSYDNDDPPPYQEHDMFNTIHLESPPSYSDAIKDTENIECGENSRSESSQTTTPRRNSIAETTV